MSENGVTVINGSASAAESETPNRIRRDSVPSDSRSRSPSPGKTPEEEKPKRFLNGWSRDQERLMSEWSDYAMCYRWIHDKSEKYFHSKNRWINIPVIILTTLGGTANFGIQSIFTNDSAKQIASFAIGGISLFAGLLTTIGNYLRYAQLEESHRVASISWGKFQRQVAVELALDPNERIDAMDFLKICRTELDRLIEQSPPIPEDSILLFQTNFGEIEGLKKPDICGSLEHTRVFESSDTRLKQAAVDAAILLRQKKHALTELMSPHIQATIQSQVEAKLQAALEEKRQQLEEEIERKKRDAHEAEEEAKRALEERQRLIYAEIDLEKKKLVAPISMTNVADMQKRRMSTVAAKHYFIKNSAPKPAASSAIDHHTPRTPRIQNSPVLLPMLAPLDSVNLIIQPDPNANLYDKHE
jgi:hypothetical protein